MREGPQNICIATWIWLLRHVTDKLRLMSLAAILCSTQQLACDVSFATWALCNVSDIILTHTSFITREATIHRVTLSGTYSYSKLKVNVCNQWMSKWSSTLYDIQTGIQLSRINWLWRSFTTFWMCVAEHICTKLSDELDMNTPLYFWCLEAEATSLFSP